MGADKTSYPPLLGPGRHRLTPPQLRALCVDRFGGAVQRAHLFSELERLFAYLESAGLICEVWVDGSFTCEKDAPDDIDVSVAFLANDADRLDPGIVAALMAKLNGGFRFSPVLDTYLCPQFLVGDPRRSADMGNYWAGKWGKGRDDWLKGFVVIGIGNTWPI